MATRSLIKYLASLLIGLMLIGMLIMLGGDGSLQQLDTLRPIPLAGAFLLTLGIMGSVAGRWGTFANSLAGRQAAGWYDYFHYFLISRAMGFVLPKDVTDLGSRTFSLNQLHAMPIAQASASVLLDRVADMLIAVLFTLAVLPFWLGWLPASAALGLVVGLALLCGFGLMLGQQRLAHIFIRLFNGGLQLMCRLPLLRTRSPVLLADASLSGQAILQAYLWSLLKLSCTAGRMVCFALALGLPISPMLLLLGTPLGQLSYMFAFTPGGLGIFEAGWFAILALGGAVPEQITAFVVGQRVLTLGIVVLLALCSQIIVLLRYRSAHAST